MTNLLTQRILLTTIWVNLNSNNPIKTRFSILISASCIFLFLKINSSTIWIPLIFFILFTGGILIIFIILSSVLPNEKTIKVKYSKVVIILIILLSFSSIKINGIEGIHGQMKRFISSGLNLIVITLIILIYFFNAINLNSKEETPMRSLQC